MTGDEQGSRHRGPAIVGAILFVIALAVAMSVDVPRTGYGIKSDEATYVAATLSAAFDRDLSFTRGDLVRFAGLYHTGPDGIFLKRGKDLRVRVNSEAPFVHLTKRMSIDQSHLYFGKAIVYPLIAAPFVWLFGLNGFLVFHVVLLAIAVTAAYLFMAAQSSPRSAAAFVSAFFGATVLPVYTVFLMPEVFNFTLVFAALFLWLYKEVAPGSSWSKPWTDVAAAALLGVGMYSKPLPIAVLVLPLVVLAWLRRRWTRGFVLGATAGVVAAAFFTLNAAVSGEFNYQGGDRKTFVARFPFDNSGQTWEQLGGGIIDDPGEAAQSVLISSQLPQRFARNLEYFFFGRHFGLVPYFFPGVVAFVVWVASRYRRDDWRAVTAAAFLLSVVALLLVLPFTWSGGGGPPGNRYFFNVYPVLFFLMPPGATALPAILAWTGGALFTAKMLVDPFGAAKFTWLVAEKGPLRRLPVELTMANDLPVRLAQPLRGHVHYGPYDERGMILYFLDQNSWPPEPRGMWVSGAGRSDIIVRTVLPVESITIEVESPIHTVLTVNAGVESATVTLEPGKIQTMSVRASGVRGAHDYNYLLQVRSSDGFIPHVIDPKSGDYRNLSAQLRFQIVTTSAGTTSPK